jgi:hypothetical protein
VETGWTVDIDVAGDATDTDSDADTFAARLTVFEEVLEPYGGAAAGSDDGDRYGARFSIDTSEDDPAEVLEHALLIFRDAAFAAELPRWPIVRCEILTYDEDDRRSEEDADDA